MKSADLPAQLLTETDLSKLPENILRGGSCIVAPDGGFVAHPIFDDETIIIAELDLTQIDKEKMTLDVSGHYSRPDIFEFAVNRKSRG
jgi:predicted amidohydrolase